MLRTARLWQSDAMLDYDQPVTILARSGSSESTTLADAVRRIMADPSILEDIGVLLLADNQLITRYSDVEALHREIEGAGNDNRA